MKRLLFILCLLFSPVDAFFKDLLNFKTKTLDEKIECAILNSNVNTVLSLVKDDNPNLQDYLHLSNKAFALEPKSNLTNKIIGFTKIALASALLYKTAHYFKTEYTAYASKSQLIKHYQSPHNILMDLSVVAQLMFSYNAFFSGMNNIDPKSAYKKQLLINLYLQNLLKR